MSKYIVDDIGTVVCKMNKTIAGYGPKQSKPCDEVFYIYGHRSEVNAQMAKKSKDRVEQYKRFPLLITNMDIAEDIAGGMKVSTLNIIIVAESKVEYTAAERYDKVYKPVLYPIYELFLKSIKAANLFTWEGELNIPPHIKLDRPFWGTAGAEGNAAAKLNSTLDAIEIMQLKLSQDLNNCK